MQNDLDIECLAVDDGSSDATLEILSAFRDKIHLRIYRPPRSGNWVTNTNLALSEARAEHVCLLHQDDMWLARRLKILKRLIRRYPQTNLFLLPSVYIDDRERRLGVWSCPLPPCPRAIDSSSVLERLLVQNFISIPAPVFKREAALRVGGLDDRLWYTADWDFWIKMAGTGVTMYYPEPLSAFRVHAGSQTVLRSVSVQDWREQIEIVFQRHFKTWQAPERIKKETWLAALFSIEVNTSLASIIHGKKPKLGKLASSVLRLGPREWRRYFRDSRIRERVSARLKTRIKPKRLASL
jgi:glycosyltransferase involved in cell wall biosynthesis